MRKIRNVAALVLAVAALVVCTLALTGHATAASASAPAVYSSSAKTVTIYGGGRCVHTHSRTVRNYSWSTKAGHYVSLVKPSITISDSYKCHS